MAMKNSHSIRRQRAIGFTLVELLVALGITVTVATIAYNLFDQAVAAKERSEATLKEVNDIETVWELLSTDLNHVIDRVLPSSAAGVFGRGPMPSFLGGETAINSAQLDDGEYLLRIARDGWANPLQQQRSDLQRVGYRWNEGELWRDYWAEMYQPLDAEPLGRRLVLSGIDAIQIRFLPRSARAVVSNDWSDSWPPNNATAVSVLPLAVEVTLTIEGVGDVQRIFTLSN